MIDVVIPARNEAKTIGPIVSVLANHAVIGTVYVMVDADTTDNTEQVAYDNGARVVCPPQWRGKGQLVTQALQHLVKTKRVMFCDADYIGLTAVHIDQLTLFNIVENDRGTMIVGVPDFPDIHTVPERFAESISWTWPWLSGIRIMEWRVAQSVELHGYLMETQLNHANHTAGRWHRFVRLQGLYSPLNFNEKRLEDMERDLQWGVKHKILPG